MDSFKISLKASAEKDLRRLPTAVLGRVAGWIDRLQTEPFPRQSLKLKDADGKYRLRVGDYRIVYEVDVEGKSVTIHSIRHRSRVYDDL